MIFFGDLQMPQIDRGGTRCSAIAERPRCGVNYSFGQKWKTETGKQYFTDIIGLSSTTVTYKCNWPKNLTNSMKKTQNKSYYYGVQGHSRSVDPKFPIEGVASTKHSSQTQKTRLNDVSYGVKIWTDLFFSFCYNLRIWQTDRQTDRQLSHR